MTEDMNDPDFRGGQNHHTLESVLEDMFDMVNEGHGQWLDEARLIIVQGKIESLRSYLRATRRAA
jgi:hypothetical protein